MPNPTSSGASLRRRAAAAALATACVAVLATPALAQRPGGPPGDVPGLPRLAWRTCQQAYGFDCATARVPLDYGNPGRRTIELSVIRRNAADPAHRLGTLFFNPGGPGVSATTALPLMYQFFPQDLRERFDIVSWDPRGVGASTAVRCFADASQAEAWAIDMPAFPVGAKERARWIDRQAELGRLCQRRSPDLLRYISTADTARDLDLLPAAMGEQKVNYLGISYGTYLGATYANLFPNRVRAMTLDGNVDPGAWVQQRSPLSTFLRQGSDLGSSQTLSRFLDLCGSSTPQHCAFSAGSPAATRTKLTQLLRRLRAHPQGDFTYSATVGAIAQGLYTVHPAWTILAGGLQELWLGRAPAAGSVPSGAPQPGTTRSGTAPGGNPPGGNPPRAIAPGGNPPAGAAAYPGFEQLPAVLCSESPNARDPRHYARLEQRSYTRAGDVGRDWAWSNEVCATWPARAAHRYTGPWNRSTTPVLTIGVTDDPATPYQNTLAMTRQLAHARLLTVRGYGHSALLNPSICAGRQESRYFIDGVLPPPGTVCTQDTPPFAVSAARGGARPGVVMTVAGPTGALMWRGAQDGTGARGQDKVLARYSLGLTP